MSKWLKTAFFAALLIGAACFFGTICVQIGQAYEWILSPSSDLLNLLLWFLLALGTVAVTAGLVAVLLRPMWVGCIAFLLSGLAMLLSWQVALVSGILVLVYVLVASLYAMGVAMELKERIRFSVRPIGEGQGILLMALVLVACGSLYLGLAAHVEREGFSLPQTYTEMLMEQIEKQVEARVPTQERQKVMAELREGFQQGIDEFMERTVKPYERFIPLAVSISLFMSLVTITRLLGWVLTTILRVVFPLLTAMRITKVVSETREVQSLVIE
jgi:ABC-type multidrug transport system fused ATPase/permease subunit